MQFLGKSVKDTKPKEPGTQKPIHEIVQLAVLGWSATILTAGYLEIIRADPTFVASIFTGCLANYGISRASNKPEAKEPTVKTEPAPKR